MWVFYNQVIGEQELYNANAVFTRFYARISGKSTRLELGNVSAERLLWVLSTAMAGLARLSGVAFSLGKRPETEFPTEFKGDLLDGVVVLHNTAVACENGDLRSGLYSRYQGGPSKTRRVPLTFIP